MDGNSMNYYVPIEFDKKRFENGTILGRRPRLTRSRIMVRRFALTPTAHKYLEIGISVGLDSYVELILGDNRGTRMVLHHETWELFIKKRVDIEQFLQSSATSSMSIHELVLERVKMRNEIIIKLTLRDTCLYMKSSTVLFLFQLEHCVEHEYFKLHRDTQVVNERFEIFVSDLQCNLFAPERDDAVKILRRDYDKTSIIDCELLAYAVDQILQEVLRRGDVA